MLEGYHTFHDQWALEGQDDNDEWFYFIDVARFEPLLESTELREIEFAHIANKRDVLRKAAYYMDHDVSHPGIVAKGMANPYDLPYRLIDGNHRLHKLQALGRVKAMFYVFDAVLVESLVEKRLRR